MGKHGKKMIAPVVISVLIVAYYIMVAVAFWAVPEVPRLLRLMLVAFPVVLAGAMIGVLVSRIKEIRSGEEDDLSKY